MYCILARSTRCFYKKPKKRQLVITYFVSFIVLFLSPVIRSHILLLLQKSIPTACIHFEIIFETNVFGLGF